MQDVRAVRGMGCDPSFHYVVLCKVRMVGVWIKRRGVVVGARRNRREKLRVHQYREGYARSFGGKNPKSVWWNDKIKAAVRRKETAWKGVLAASDEETKKCMEAHREEKRKVKRCIIQSKKSK